MGDPHKVEKESISCDDPFWKVSESSFNVQLQNDLIAQYARETFPLLPSSEMNQYSIPARSITHQGDSKLRGSTFNWSLLDIIGQHMRSHESICDVGKPRVIIFCSSANRVLQFYHYLRATKGNEYLIRKLFGRHIKLAEAVEVLKSKSTGIAIGTSARISDLLNTNALNLDNTSLLVIDSSFRDVKNRTIWDWKESREPLLSIIKNPVFRSRLDDGNLSILNF